MFTINPYWYIFWSYLLFNGTPPPKKNKTKKKTNKKPNKKTLQITHPWKYAVRQPITCKFKNPFTATTEFGCKHIFQICWIILTSIFKFLSCSTLHTCQHISFRKWSRLFTAFSLGQMVKGQEHHRNIWRGQIMTERRTHGQSSDQLWRSERRNRIHSSKFGKKCKGQIIPTLTNVQITWQNSTRNICINCFSWKMLRIYCITIIQRKIGNSNKKNCIFVSKTHSYLAASPDAMIDDDKLIEI